VRIKNLPGLTVSVKRMRRRVYCGVDGLESGLPNESRVSRAALMKNVPFPSSRAASAPGAC